MVWHSLVYLYGEDATDCLDSLGRFFSVTASAASSRNPLLDAPLRLSSNSQTVGERIQVFDVD